MRRGEPVECPAHDRVLREPVDGRLARRLDADPVAEVETLEDRHDLMLAVATDRPDDERQVDLRRSGADHESSPVSATNSAGSSSSARTFAARPIAARAVTDCSREATAASERELASVLRRWPNPASTTRLT